MLKQITTGACICATGILVESQGAGQSSEIQAKTLEIYGLCDNTYPMQKKGQSFEVMRKNAHLRLRTNTFGAVMRIRHNMAIAIHQYFHEHGFFYFHTPLITASDCEGAGQMFQVVVIVVDDLASTMAVAIVTKKQGVQLAHIAAGTRSFDITMPKEINRLVIDGLSDILFTAGISNNSIANKEGAELSKVYMVGNVLIDNIRFLQQRMQRPAVMDEMHLEEGKYMVLTLNRKAIVNNIDEMKSLITVIDSVARKAGIKVVAPLRGKALGFVLAFKAYQDVADHQSGIMVVQPQGYLEFLYLTAHAMGVITDSGNVAEEATFNGVPCVTLNSYTEHMETVTVGTNELVAEDPEKLQNAMEKILNGEWKKAGIPDRWDGRSAERIVQILAE